MTCAPIQWPGGRRGFICLVDNERLVTPNNERLVTPNPDCPLADQHTLHPAGYHAHHDWAAAMLDTHEQRQCPGCGLWVIWTARPTHRGA